MKKTMQAGIDLIEAEIQRVQTSIDLLREQDKKNNNDDNFDLIRGYVKLIREYDASLIRLYSY